MEKTVWIFEEFFIDGFGQKRIAGYAPVESREVGWSMINAILDNEVDKKKYNVEKMPDDSGVILSIKENCKSLNNKFDGHCLCVREENLINKLMISQYSYKKRCKLA